MKEKSFFSYHKKSAGRDYLVALTTTVIIAGLCFPVADAIGYQTVGLIFLMTIAVLSLFLGRGALIFAAILNSAVWNFFFIKPLFTLRVHGFHDLIALITNLLVAITASALISRIRASQVTMKRSQDNLILLHSFLESLNNAVSIKEVVVKAAEGLKNNFNAEMILYLKEKKGTELSGRVFGNSSLHNEVSFSIASTLFKDPEAKNHTYPERIPVIWFYPLTDPRQTLGIIGIVFPHENPPGEDRLIFLKSFIVQIASALYREMNVDALREKEVSVESEKLFQTVLNSVSHELRTPISIISAAVANLNDPRTASSEVIRHQIGEELEVASNRLNHLVENILDMSRIESGLLRLNLQFCDITDLIGIVIKEISADLQKHNIIIKTDDTLPLIRADINLLKQAVINVLHNAAVYTPAGSNIIVEGYTISPAKVCISISDSGAGIPEASLSHLFEKFYRVPGSKSGGTGLGLTITRAIVDLHGGEVFAGNRKEGGFQVILTLNTDIRNGQ